MTPEMAGVFLEGLVKNEVRNTQIKAGMRAMRAANQLRNFASTGFGADLVVGIQSGMNYSGYLETGTKKMAARPYVEKIKETALPNIIPIFEELG